MEKYIDKVLKLAEKSKKHNEFPVAAIIYKDNKIISYGYNRRNKSQKTTDHAEIIAIQKANKKLHSWRLNGYTMLITLEPCDMCKTVIKESRIDNVYYLVERYKYKNQYKNTIFKLLSSTSDGVENYKASIKHFFNTKR